MHVSEFGETVQYMVQSSTLTAKSIKPHLLLNFVNLQVTIPSHQDMKNLPWANRPNFALTTSRAKDSLPVQVLQQQLLLPILGIHQKLSVSNTKLLHTW